MHVDIVIVPERHDEDHTILKGLAHSLQAALLGEVIRVTEDGLLVLAEGVGDRVAADASNVGYRLVPDFASLDVLATDLDKIAASGVIRGDELSHNGERLGGVDGLARAVERLVAHPEGVEVATIPVAVTLVAVTVARATSFVRSASGVARSAGVGGHSVGDLVGLPDIHFIAAGAGLAKARVCVVGSWGPAVAVRLTVDELDVLGALSITVPCSELGTGLVSGRNATVCWHGHEVQSAIETTYSRLISSGSGHLRYGILTFELADVDIERELLVLQLEELVVLVLIIHEVDSGANIAASLELETQGVARCLDTVGAGVVSAIECAVRRASCAIRAQSLVPGVTCVAVGGAGGGVEPTPVAVKHNALGLGRASAASSASGNRESRVLLRSKGPSLLSVHNRAEGEGTQGEGKGRHACRLFLKV